MKAIRIKSKEVPLVVTACTGKWLLIEGLAYEVGLHDPLAREVEIPLFPADERDPSKEITDPTVRGFLRHTLKN